VGAMDFIENHAPYDIFCCNQVLEHLDKPKESLRQLKGLLNQKAVGFISVPDFSLRRMDRLIKDIKQGKSVIKEINPWGHLNYFTATSLRQMLFDLQFREIQTPLPSRFNLLLPKKNDCNLSLFQRFLAHQSKAFRVLLDVLRKAGQPSNQAYTSVFVKINKP
jgi:2-polyprenyl-3-methyl-5-hydroxy-6-metoxy-1,4-benzoquinol methylase